MCVIQYNNKCTNVCYVYVYTYVYMYMLHVHMNMLQLCYQLYVFYHWYTISCVFFLEDSFMNLNDEN